MVAIPWATACWSSRRAPAIPASGRSPLWESSSSQDGSDEASRFSSRPAIRTRASLSARAHKGAHGQYGRGMTTEADSLPRRHARTQRFTLSAPRAFTVAPDGSRVVFLQSGLVQVWVTG